MPPAPHQYQGRAAIAGFLRASGEQPDHGVDVVRRPGQAAARPGLAVATAFLDAWTGQDFDAAGQYLADYLVFDGPVAHYRSARDFLEGSRPFAARLRPGWSAVAAFGDDKQALLLYDLLMVSGGTMRVADHYVVEDGKIQAEQIPWDTGANR